MVVNTISTIDAVNAIIVPITAGISKYIVVSLYDGLAGVR
jgi:hypothetical protein